MYSILGEVYSILGEVYSILGEVYSILGEVYSILGECYACKIRSTYNITVCTVPVTNAYRKIARSDH